MFEKECVATLEDSSQESDSDLDSGSSMYSASDENVADIQQIDAADSFKVPK